MKYIIDFKIKNNDEEYIKKNLNAIYENKKLIFNYDNERIEIKLDSNNIIMKKENSESEIIFDFKLNKKTSTKYYIKDMNFFIDTEVLTKYLIINDNYIYIEYDLWLSNEKSGSFKYEINIKEEQ